MSARLASSSMKIDRSGRRLRRSSSHRSREVRAHASGEKRTKTSLCRRGQTANQTAQECCGSGMSGQWVEIWEPGRAGVERLRQTTHVGRWGRDSGALVEKWSVACCVFVQWSAEAGFPGRADRNAPDLLNSRGFPTLQFPLPQIGTTFPLLTARPLPSVRFSSSRTGFGGRSRGHGHPNGPWVFHVVPDCRVSPSGSAARIANHTLPAVEFARWRLVTVSNGLVDSVLAAG